MRRGVHPPLLSPLLPVVAVWSGVHPERRLSRSRLSSLLRPVCSNDPGEETSRGVLEGCVHPSSSCPSAAVAPCYASGGGAAWLVGTSASQAPGKDQPIGEMGENWRVGGEKPGTLPRFLLLQQLLPPLFPASISLSIAPSAPTLLPGHPTRAAVYAGGLSVWLQ